MEICDGCEQFSMLVYVIKLVKLPEWTIAVFEGLHSI